VLGGVGFPPENREKPRHLGRGGFTEREESGKKEYKTCNL